MGHHLLILKSGDEILKEIQIEKEDDIFWRAVGFVKIRKEVYWSDLNEDGYVEFAVLKLDTGNAEYRVVDLYTLKDNSFDFYGNGIYMWTAGQHVMLNCLKCSRYNLEACEKSL